MIGLSAAAAAVTGLFPNIAPIRRIATPQRVMTGNFSIPDAAGKPMLNN